eukprot:COSAG02_NODE_220_length_28426_cov_28.546863_22_plen_179_part_00
MISQTRHTHVKDTSNCTSLLRTAWLWPEMSCQWARDRSTLRARVLRYTSRPWFHPCSCCHGARAVYAVHEKRLQATSCSSVTQTMKQDPHHAAGSGADALRTVSPRASRATNRLINEAQAAAQPCLYIRIPAARLRVYLYLIEYILVRVTSTVSTSVWVLPDSDPGRCIFKSVSSSSL